MEPMPSLCGWWSRSSRHPLASAYNGKAPNSNSPRRVSPGLLKESSLAVYDILGLTSKKRFQVVDGGAHQAGASFTRGPGQMRRNNAVFSVEQRVVRGWRFAREHIKSRARQLPLI